jgi:hypothetical protein
LWRSAGLAVKARSRRTARARLGAWRPDNARSSMPESSYELLATEAQRRGVEPDALADELVRADLGARGADDLESALGGLAQLRERMPEIDGVLLARNARAALERRDR